MAKKQRNKIELRTRIHQNVKRETAAKLNYTCPHCGKKFTYSDLTNEHIIPLAKGGSNDASNLTLLCRDCNAYKSNLIVHEDWYGHVTKHVKQEISHTINQYIKQFAWLTPHSFFPYDVIPIDYKMLLPNGSKVSKRTWLKKAVYNEYQTSDFDKIYEFATIYNQQHHIDCFGDELNRCILEYFQDGAVYYTESNGSIVSMFAFELTDFVCKNDEQDGTHYGLFVKNPMCLYDNHSYGSFVYSVLETVKHNLMSEIVKHNLQMFPICLDMFDPDSKISQLFAYQMHGRMACDLCETDHTDDKPNFQFRRYQVILSNLCDSNGESMKSDDLELLSSIEMKKTDNYIRRLIYNEK